MGFLSPQTCPSNPNYPATGTNPYNKPAFKKPDYVPLDLPPPVIPNADDFEDFGEYEEASLRYSEDYAEWERIMNNHRDLFELGNVAEKAQFDTKYNCPKGLVSTTPGTVVASQITNAMGSFGRQTELGAALGSSMSAIFDTLLNKFLGDGLNALTSKTNTEPEPDNWDYYGNTLGSSDDGIGNSWDAGPDELIILEDFKKKLDGYTILATPVCEGGPSITATTIEECSEQNGVWVTTRTGNTGNGEYAPGDIANTETEIKLIYNDVTVSIDQNTGKILNDPGIMQILGIIWPTTFELDICLPGPDLGWKDRAVKETQRNSAKLEEEASKQTGERAAVAASILRELTFAVDFFKDWVTNKMMLELPHAISYMDAVDELETAYQQSDELVDQRRAKSSALARLQAIRAGLAGITAQPLPGSAG